MDLHAVEILAKELMSRYVPDYTFGWNKKKTMAAMCFYTTKQIQFSIPMTLVREEWAVLQTIYHEIAHALTPGAGHGRLWKEQMAAFGYPDVKSCTPDVIDKSSFAGWTAVCSFCQNRVYMIRKPRVHKSCALCKPSFDQKYVLSFTRM